MLTFVDRFWFSQFLFIPEKDNMTPLTFYNAKRYASNLYIADALVQQAYLYQDK